MSFPVTPAVRGDGGGRTYRGGSSVAGLDIDRGTFPAVDEAVDVGIEVLARVVFVLSFDMRW